MDMEKIESNPSDIIIDDKAPVKSNASPNLVISNCEANNHLSQNSDTNHVNDASNTEQSKPLENGVKQQHDHDDNEPVKQEFKTLESPKTESGKTEAETTSNKSSSETETDPSQNQPIENDLITAQNASSPTHRDSPNPESNQVDFQNQIPKPQSDKETEENNQILKESPAKEEEEPMQVDQVKQEDDNTTHHQQQANKVPKSTRTQLVARVKELSRILCREEAKLCIAFQLRNNQIVNYERQKQEQAKEQEQRSAGQQRNFLPSNKAYSSSSKQALVQKMINNANRGRNAPVRDRGPQVSANAVIMQVKRDQAQQQHTKLREKQAEYEIKVKVLQQKTHELEQAIRDKTSNFNTQLSGVQARFDKQQSTTRSALRKEVEAIIMNGIESSVADIPRDTVPFIPSQNIGEILFLTGLEDTVQQVLTGVSATDSLSFEEPTRCSECGTDFTHSWYRDENEPDVVLCARCLKVLGGKFLRSRCETRLGDVMKIADEKEKQLEQELGKETIKMQSIIAEQTEAHRKEVQRDRELLVKEREIYEVEKNKYLEAVKSAQAASAALAATATARSSPSLGSRKSSTGNLNRPSQPNLPRLTPTSNKNAKVRVHQANNRRASPAVHQQGNQTLFGGRIAQKSSNSAKRSAASAGLPSSQQSSSASRNAAAAAAAAVSSASSLNAFNAAGASQALGHLTLQQQAAIFSNPHLLQQLFSGSNTLAALGLGTNPFMRQANQSQSNQDVEAGYQRYLLEMISQQQQQILGAGNRSSTNPWGR